MIHALEKLDNRTAAGLLARAALALEGDGNPAASTILDNEGAIRDALFREARERLGLELDDLRPEAVEKLGDFFDEESERLIEPPDTQSALERLAERGDLASDLYRINIIPNIVQLHGKNFELEQKIINRTVRSPDREQHYGPPTEPGQPFLISLFAKKFRTLWPYKDFTMLVAGRRDKLDLHIHQAWRIYSAFVNDMGASLVELLERFADVYGIDLHIEGKTGHFFLMSDRPPQQRIEVDAHGKKTEYTISHFMANNAKTGKMESSLIVAIDLDKYRATLQKMEVRSDQIIW